MKQQATFEDWDFVDTWHIIEGVTYPYLLNNQPIEVYVSNQIYTGSQIKPEPIVYINSGDKPALIKDTDYSLTYGTNIDLGIGTITITGLGDYSWFYKEISFEICISLLLAANAIQPIAEQTYTGSAIIPDVVVKYGYETLIEGTDYDITFINNTNEGTATVIVTGKGNYSGIATADFIIDAQTPILSPQIAISNIGVQTIGNRIILENLPQNAKVEVYNMQGKRVYLGNSGNSKILQILIQTKGVYILKTGKTIQRVALK